MSRQAQVNSVVRDQFPVFESDGYTKRSGETAFDTSLWVDGTLSSVSVSISEIGVSGEYEVTFIPNSLGTWVLEIAIPFNRQRWAETVLVGLDQGEAQLNVAYDGDTGILYMDAWLDRDGTAIPQSELSSCAVSIFDPAGGLMFTSSSTSPGTDGKFRMQQTIGLTSERSYSAVVTIEDSRGAVKTSQAFSTAG